MAFRKFLPCLSFYLTCLFLCLPHGHASNKDAIDEQSDAVVIVSNDFLEACTHGHIDQIRTILQQHPDFVHGRSLQGETCLHVAGILGQTAVTQLLLDAGADPNARSTFAHGLRMHPLSWNVYGGHAANVKLLLRHGANVNLDVDSMKDASVKVTCLDIVSEILRKDAGDNDAELDNWQQIRQVLLDHGGRHYADDNKNEHENEL